MTPPGQNKENPALNPENTGEGNEIQNQNINPAQETGADLANPKTVEVSADVSAELSSEKTPEIEFQEAAQEYLDTVTDTQFEANKEVRDYIDAGLDTQPKNDNDVKMAIQTITLDLLSGVNKLASEWKVIINLIYEGVNNNNKNLLKSIPENWQRVVQSFSQNKNSTYKEKLSALYDLQTEYLEKINEKRKVISMYILDAASGGHITEAILSMIQNEIENVSTLINSNSDLSQAFKYYVGMRSDKDPHFNDPKTHNKTIINNLRFGAVTPTMEAKLCFTIIKTMSSDQKIAFMEEYREAKFNNPAEMQIFLDNASKYGAIGPIEIEEFFSKSDLPAKDLQKYSDNYKRFTDTQEQSKNFGEYDAENAFLKATQWDNVLATGAEAWGAITVLSNVFVNFCYATKDSQGFMDTLFKGVPSAAKSLINPSSILGAGAATVGYIYKEKNPDILSKESEKFNTLEGFYTLMQNMDWGSHEMGFFSTKAGDLDGEGINAFSEFLSSVYQKNENPKDKDFSSENLLKFLRQRGVSDFRNQKLIAIMEKMKRQNKYLDQDILKFVKIFKILEIGGKNAKQTFTEKFKESKKIREK